MKPWSDRREDALMAGEIALERQATEYEEAAEHDHLDWAAKRRWYHTAGRKRLQARDLRRMYREPRRFR